MKIALVDPFLGGHHQTYLKLYSYALLELGYEVTIFCANPEEVLSYTKSKNSQYLKNLKGVKFQSFFKNIYILAKLNWTYNSFCLWRATAKIIKNTCYEDEQVFDQVFFLWLDSYLAPLLPTFIINIIFPYSWGGLYFHPKHLRKEFNSNIKKFFFFPDNPLKSDRCKGVALLDEGVLSKLSKELHGKFCTVFPDITDCDLPGIESDLIREIKERAGKRIVISILGGLTKRKGIITLLEASELCSGDFFFIFAGKLRTNEFSPSELYRLRSLAKSKEKYFCYFDRIPDEKEFNAIVKISDILFAAYHDFFHSSNIITKAAVYKKLIIVSKGCCSSERVDKFKMGVSVEQANINDSVNAINRLAQSELLYQMQKEGLFNEYMQLNNVKLLKCKLNEFFKSANG